MVHCEKCGYHNTVVLQQSKYKEKRQCSECFHIFNVMYEVCEEEEQLVRRRI